MDEACGLVPVGAGKRTEGRGKGRPNRQETAIEAGEENRQAGHHRKEEAEMHSRGP